MSSICINFESLAVLPILNNCISNLTEQQTLDPETTESDREALITNIEGKSKRLISWSGLIRNLITGFRVLIWNCQRHQQTETNMSSKPNRASTAMAKIKPKKSLQLDLAGLALFAI